MPVTVQYSPDAALQAYVASTVGAGQEANQRRQQLDQQQGQISQQGIELAGQSAQYRQMMIQAQQHQQQMALQASQQANDQRNRQQQMALQQQQGQMDAQKAASAQMQHNYEFEQQKQMVQDHQDAQQQALSYRENVELEQAKAGRAQIMSDPDLGETEKQQAAALYDPKISSLANRQAYSKVQQQRVQLQDMQTKADMDEQALVRQTKANADAAAFSAKTIDQRTSYVPLDPDSPDGPRAAVIDQGPGRPPLVIQPPKAEKPPKEEKEPAWDAVKERHQAEAEVQNRNPGIAEKDKHGGHTQEYHDAVNAEVAKRKEEFQKKSRDYSAPGEMTNNEKITSEIEKKGFFGAMFGTADDAKKAQSGVQDSAPDNVKAQGPAAIMQWHIDQAQKAQQTQQAKAQLDTMQQVAARVPPESKPVMAELMEILKNQPNPAARNEATRKRYAQLLQHLAPYLHGVPVGGK